MQNSLVNDTSPGKNSSEYTSKRKSEISCGKRDLKMVGEGSNNASLAKQGSACSKSISEQYFPCKERRWGLPSGYKSKNSESVYTLYALQNGKFADFKICDEGKRLHVQNRFEGQLFYSTSRQIMSSSSEVFMGRESLQISVSLFGLGPAPRVFTKILKVPISLLRRLNIRILIYLDDMLLMSQSIERLLVARDTVIFLLQHLRFVKNLKKSVMETVQTIKYLGLVINSIRMTLSLTEEKVKGNLQEYKIIFLMKEITVLQLTQLVGLLSSTIQTVLPAQINFCYLQLQQVSALDRRNVLQRENYSKRLGTSMGVIEFRPRLR